MKTAILLLRHGESLKNTLDAYSTISGEEPLTKYGIYQAQCAADYIHSYFEESGLKYLQLLSGNDIRSLKTSEPISKLMNIGIITNDNLSAFVGSESQGKLATDIYQEYPDLEKKIKLYRSGLLSAYEVPWLSGNTLIFEKKLSKNFVNSLLIDNCLSIVTTHKSVITCLAMIFLKRYCNYPENYYGYVDIPLGASLLLEIDNNHLNINKIDYLAKTKSTKTDVVLRDGIITFPKSSCAICWDNDSLLLVNQMRHGSRTWELPGGKVEEFESPVETAIRELKEETGLNATKGKIIYSLDLDLSISFHRTYLVNCYFDKNQHVNFNTARWLPFNVVLKMVNEGSITHAPTIVAFLNKYKILGSEKTNGGIL